jgi:hypothetical protein
VSGRKERTEHVAADRVIVLMVNRAGVEHRLHGAEDGFDLPQLLVFERELLGGQIRIACQHPLAIEARFACDLLLVNAEVLAICLEAAAIAAVADEGFVALLERAIFKFCSARRAGGRAIPS